jgi:hypothetical protein
MYTIMAHTPATRRETFGTSFRKRENFVAVAREGTKDRLF